MKLYQFDKRIGDKQSIALSVVVHVFAIMLIAGITFRYPIARFFETAATPPAPIHYVTVAPTPRGEAGDGSPRTKPPKKAANPIALLAPSVIPTALPPIPPPSAHSGSVNGSANGSGAPVGIATGVEAALPDSRIELRPNALHVPISTAERNDSAVKAIFMAYREAEIAAEEHRGRDPKDWTFGHDGAKYGLDSQYIYLGKFKVPSAILAALPLNPHGVDGTRIQEGREASLIQNDIYLHSQGMSEDDFRAAVKRIRERKDREKKEDQDAKDRNAGTKPANPIVP